MPVLAAQHCANPSQVARLLEDSVEAMRWLTANEGSAPECMESRIAQLLEDLHQHLSLAEDPDNRLAASASQEEREKRSKFDPAPSEVLNRISTLTVDGQVLKRMQQEATCVVCCGDFEVGETLSELPGCSHLFHGECIKEWLERASNCPICRNDLKAVAGVGEQEEPNAERSAQSSSSSSAPASSCAPTASQDQGVSSSGKKSVSRSWLDRGGWSGSASSAGSSSDKRQTGMERSRRNRGSG